MSLRGWALFALLSVAWGIPYLLIKVAVAELPVPVLVFGRVAAGAALLLPLAIHGGRLKELRGHAAPLAAFATLEFIIPWGLLSHAEIRISSSMAGLLMASIPILALLMARLAGDRERLGKRRLAGLLAGFAGVAALVRPQAGGDLLALLEVLLAAVCYAGGALVAARRLGGLPALPMTTVCLAIAAVVYLPPAVAAWPETLPSSRALVAMGVLALFCTALAFVCFFALIREVGMSRAVVITYVNPAVAVAGGVLLLSEPLTPAIVGAFVLILGGSFLATSASGDRPAPSQTSSARHAA